MFERYCVWGRRLRCERWGEFLIFCWGLLGGWVGDVGVWWGKMRVYMEGFF
jgi:hypothetical protein